MRVRRLDVISYGQLREQSLDFSSPDSGLTVVMGPNEAGKSTAMRALVSLLYGIERRTADDHGFGREGLKIGAVLEDDGRSLEVVRQGLLRQPLVAPDGAPIDETVLLPLLGGVDRALYTTLFCVDHDELHENSEALLRVDGEIGQLVYGASLGATALSRVLADIDQRANALFLARGSSQKLAKALAHRRELLQEAKALRVRSRDWEKAEHERVRLEGAQLDLREQIAGLRARLGRLDALKSALPLLAKRAVLLEALTAIEQDGPVQSAEWAQRVQALHTEARSVKEGWDRDAAERDALRRHIAGLSVPDDVLAVADELDLLFERIERFRKDVADLPKLETRLDAARQREAELYRQSGLTAEAGRHVTELQMAEVESLANERPALVERVAHAQRERDAVRELVGNLTDELGLLPEAPEVSSLSRRLELVRPHAEQEKSLPVARAELNEKRTDVRVTARRLGLESLANDMLEALAPPSAEALDAYREARTRFETEIAGYRQRRGQLEEEQAERSVRREKLTAKQGTPEPDEVDLARSRRDEGWSLVRVAWLEGAVADAEVAEWTGGEALADAYVESVRTADVAADRRYDHAEQLTILDEIDEATRSCEAELALIEERQREVERLLAALNDEWLRFWSDLGAEAPAPRQAPAWLESLRSAQELLAECRATAARLDAEENQISEQREALATELRALGFQPPPAASLAELVQLAKECVDSAQGLRANLDRTGQELESAQRALPQRELALTNARQVADDWSTRWSAALQPMRLMATVSPEAALKGIALVREARGEQRAASDLDERVVGLRQDITAFRTRVAEAVAQIQGITPDLDAGAALMSVKPMLSDAREQASSRRALQGQLATVNERIQEAETRMQSIQRGLEGLRTGAALDQIIDLSAEAARSMQAAEIREGVQDVERLLLSQSEGRSLDETLRSAQEYDFEAGRIDSEREALEEEIRALETQRDEQGQALAEVRTQIKGMDASGRAAAKEQEAELELAQVASHAHHYCRLAVAGELLRRVVAEYGRQHRGPIIDRASEHFRRLTDEAFSGLLVDFAGDSQVLLARRRNGELLRVTQLSEGTLDQLYLALRLAGIEHQLDRCMQPLPVILDDLLVNFDDGRARAAVRVLADLGKHTQVLLFTHHEHVCDMACDVLHLSHVAVTRLKARDHDAPPAPAALDVKAASTRSSRPGGVSADHQQSVLEVLRGSSIPLGKAEIVASSSVPESAWQATIRSLVDSGMVVQEGAKRGARYRLA